MAMWKSKCKRAGQAYQRIFNQFAAQTACLQLPDFDFDPSQYVDKSLVGLGAGAALAARLALAAGDADGNTFLGCGERLAHYLPAVLHERGRSPQVAQALFADHGRLSVRQPSLLLCG